MKNVYRRYGNIVVIELWNHADKTSHETTIDLADLPIADSMRGTWNAVPARSPKGKFYAMAKIWDCDRQKSVNTGLHRLILGLTDRKMEGHHKDNNGLNNRRYNLEAVDHKRNMRERTPGRDWAAIDTRRLVADEYRKERAIAADVALTHGITRQMLWKIRDDSRIESAAAIDYRDRCKVAGVRTLEELKLRAKSASSAKYSAIRGDLSPK